MATERSAAAAARLARLCSHVKGAAGGDEGVSSSEAALLATAGAAADSFESERRTFLPPPKPAPGAGSGPYDGEEEDEYYEDGGADLAAENAARGRNDVYNRKWDGWGYEDTEFYIDDDTQCALSGERYGNNFEAERVLPEFREWVEAKVDGFSTDETSFGTGERPYVAPSVMNDAFLAEIEGSYVELCFDDDERLFHAHGHTTRELYDLRTGKGFTRCPDAVVYPGSHEQVEVIMAAAVRNDACIIPFGGGTSVTGALLCPDTEKRMIVSVDMRRMNRIKWVDRESMMCCIEAGAAGQELDRALSARGLRLGHEPDSGEFSTVGGWVATRASGMKKSVYGNIEDMLINVKVVTPIGTLDRAGNAPRQVRPSMRDRVTCTVVGLSDAVRAALVPRSRHDCPHFPASPLHASLYLPPPAAHLYVPQSTGPDVLQMVLGKVNWMNRSPQARTAACSRARPVLSSSSPTLHPVTPLLLTSSLRSFLGVTYRSNL